LNNLGDLANFPTTRIIAQPLCDSFKKACVKSATATQGENTAGQIGKSTSVSKAQAGWWSGFSRPNPMIYRIQA